ncbi:MAG: hypothetical protein KTR35_03080, partial [Gammaproteobacteria bacterium]|nr:hypothetical protein [Gammaproteobacteria bacterium]
INVTCTLRTEAIARFLSTAMQICRVCTPHTLGTNGEFRAPIPLTANGENNCQLAPGSDPMELDFGPNGEQF